MIDRKNNCWLHLLVFAALTLVVLAAGRGLVVLLKLLNVIN